MYLLFVFTHFIIFFVIAQKMEK